MYPSKPNADKVSDTPKVVALSDTANEKHGPPSDVTYHSSNPSAPLLPPGPYNPLPPPNMEPPPYSSVVAQDSSDWKNSGGSFSGANNSLPYPPGPANQSPYPTGRSSPYGPPTQAPYPPGPEFSGNAPYPSGPGLGSGITSQPPYSTGSGYTPGPASQAPYPIASMPIPGPVDTDRKIGFTVPVTTEPKPMNPGFQPSPYPTNGNQQGLIYPHTTGENNPYIQTSQYMPNQYGQQQPQQQPNTIYVVQKAPEQNNSVDDDCACIACCLASCYCLCECVKICAAIDS